MVNVVIIIDLVFKTTRESAQNQSFLEDSYFLITSGILKHVADGCVHVCLKVDFQVLTRS